VNKYRNTTMVHFWFVQQPSYRFSDLVSLDAGFREEKRKTARNRYWRFSFKSL